MKDPTWGASPSRELMLIYSCDELYDLYVKESEIYKSFLSYIEFIRNSDSHIAASFDNNSEKIDAYNSIKSMINKLSSRFVSHLNKVIDDYNIAADSSEYIDHLGEKIDILSKTTNDYGNEIAGGILNIFTNIGTSATALYSDEAIEFFAGKTDELTGTYGWTGKEFWKLKKQGCTKNQVNKFTKASKGMTLAGAALSVGIGISNTISSWNDDSLTVATKIADTVGNTSWVAGNVIGTVEVLGGKSFGKLGAALSVTDRIATGVAGMVDIGLSSDLSDKEKGVHMAATVATTVISSACDIAAAAAPTVLASIGSGILPGVGTAIGYAAGVGIGIGLEMAGDFIVDNTANIANTICSWLGW